MATQAVKNTLYRWQGTDGNGVKTSGQISADSHAMIRVQLRRQGITVSKIRRHYSRDRDAGKSITALDITLFTRQLATLISAGIALQQALGVIADGFESRAMRQQVTELKTGHRRRHQPGGSNGAQKTGTFRPAVLQPRRSGGTGRGAGRHAATGSDLQGENRSPEKEKSKSHDLPQRRALGGAGGPVFC